MTPEMLKQLQMLVRNGNLSGSDRAEDRARSKLKKLGLIKFDRPAWLWRITDAGRAALSSPST